MIQSVMMHVKHAVVVVIKIVSKHRKYKKGGSKMKSYTYKKTFGLDAKLYMIMATY